MANKILNVVGICLITIGTIMSLRTVLITKKKYVGVPYGLMLNKNSFQKRKIE